MNIIVQTTGVYASSLNGKSESHNNNKLSNITKTLLLNSSQNKELWCFSYHYAICLSFQTENRLCGDVPNFLWHGTIPSYKNIKILGVLIYIINVCVTRKKLDDTSHQGYFIIYTDTTGVIIYWKTDKYFVIHRAYHFWLYEYNYLLTIEDKHNPGYLLL